MTTLGEDYPVQQARLRALITQYRSPELNGAGEWAAQMMEQCLKTADNASISGDLMGMIASYRAMKSWKE